MIKKVVRVWSFVLLHFLFQAQHLKKEAANRELNMLLSTLTSINEREALLHLENMIKKDVKGEPLNIYESLNSFSDFIPCGFKQQFSTVCHRTGGIHFTL